MWKIYEVATGRLLKDGFITLKEADDWGDQNVSHNVSLSFVEYDEKGDKWAYNWPELSLDERAEWAKNRAIS